MAIQINGDGTITGINVGGLPNGIVDTDMLAANAVTPAKSTIQGGKVLQFKQAEASGVHSSANSGGTGQDVSGMSQSFTLTSSSNKVLVMISLNPYLGGSGIVPDVKLDALRAVKSTAAQLRFPLESVFKN